MSDFQKKGGEARAAKLTKEQRSEIASSGARARWLKADPSRKDLPRAEYGSEDRPLRIGDLSLPCFVLNDERRVLTTSGMLESLSMARGGSMIPGMNRFELFATRERINPFVSNELMERIRNPIIFLTPTGQKAHGYEAEVLVELCEAVLAARAAKRLQTQQLGIAHQCEVIIRGLARVGIVGLVDEATGYQDVRKRDALHKILEAYISPDLIPWTKRFPDEFYKEMFRLHGWDYDPASVKRPGVVGKFTNQFVYHQLPPGVLDELRSKNPKDDLGRRRVRHHQYLTQDVGNPNLEGQITKVVTLMQAAENWAMFKRLFARVFPKRGDQSDMLPD